MTEIPVMLSPNTGKYKPEKTPYLDTFSNNVKKLNKGNIYVGPSQKFLPQRFSKFKLYTK